MATNARLKSDLLKRLSITPQALSLRAKKVKRRLPMSTEEAIYLIAHQEGLDLSGYLEADMLARIRGHVRDLDAIAKASAPTPIRVPAASTTKTTSRTPKTPARRRGTSVFVVHGRNARLRKELFSFLRSVGLQPLEWTKAIAETKKGSPYIGDILDAAFRKAVAIVVLLTPDDLAQLKEAYQKTNDPPWETQLTGQARPNVLFEAGMAFGHREESTVLVQIGDLRPFSDVVGRHVLHLTNSPESRQEFVTKLANAGSNVDTSGTDWLSEGDFSLDKGA